MGTYDTRGGHPLHDPAFDEDGTTQLQDDLLAVLEAAGVDAPVSDRIIALVSEWELAQPFGSKPPRPFASDFSPRLPVKCADNPLVRSGRLVCDGKIHHGYDGREPYGVPCPNASAMSVSDQAPKGLEAKPASAVPKGDAP